MYSDKYTIHLVGKQITNDDNPNRHPFVSTHEERQQNHVYDGKWRREWERLQHQGLTIATIEEYISVAEEKVDDLKKAIAMPRKTARTLRAKATTATWAYRNNRNPDLRDSLFSEMKTTQANSREAYDQLAVIQDQLSKANKGLYFWRKINVAAKAAARAASTTKGKGRGKTSTAALTTPTWNMPAAEDSPEHLDVSNLLSQHGTVVDGRQHLVGFWTEDPGIRVMSENGFRSLQSIKDSINRFECLRGMLLKAVMFKCSNVCYTFQMTND
jgi:hypothetical protein